MPAKSATQLCLGAPPIQEMQHDHRGLQSTIKSFFGYHFFFTAHNVVKGNVLLLLIGKILVYKAMVMYKGAKGWNAWRSCRNI
uniref:Uncharacterized protein n=1 Tax=Melanopsichium pennsylvanicum 4 TaxID=1398559 RepID=A0A077R6K6_9BASI|nr:uncharacterized protein BN887_06171 [Melanopsichium pennsylvanicum 4]